MVKSLINKLHVKNKELLDEIFPDKEIVVVELPKGLEYTPNMIVWKNILLYGQQGAGKSEFCRALAEKAIEKYGEENVNFIVGQAGHLEYIYQYLDDKPIQIILVDDLTLVQQAKGALHDFFRIRHKYSKMGKRTNGYILTIMGLHRFHSIAQELRTNFDFLIIKSCPDSKWDRDFLKNYFDSERLKEIAWIDKNKLKNRSLFSYALVRDKTGNEGWLKLGMSKKSYMNIIEEDGSLVPYKGDMKENKIKEKETEKKEKYPYRCSQLKKETVTHTGFQLVKHRIGITFRNIVGSCVFGVFSSLLLSSFMDWSKQLSIPSVMLLLSPFLLSFVIISYLSRKEYAGKETIPHQVDKVIMLTRKEAREFRERYPDVVVKREGIKELEELEAKKKEEIEEEEEESETFINIEATLLDEKE